MNLNSSSTHPLQSDEWAEFRKKTGVKVVKRKNFQLTIHKIPHAAWTIGYLPKGPMPDKKMIEELENLGKEEKCIFIQIEPNVPIFTSEEPVPVTSEVAEGLLRGGSLKMLDLRPSFHPLFTKYTFILDLTKSEEELLKNLHPKTRYNIKVAQKHSVKVIEDNSDEAFEEYLKLTQETTKRQNFYAHDEKYHRVMWETLMPQLSVFGYRLSDDSKSVNQSIGQINRETEKPRNQNPKTENRKLITDANRLTAHLFLAKYKSKTLVSWILFVYNDTLYYPYGASSSEHREIMASNIMMWEAIKFGKKLGLKNFDMWGSLGPDPDKNDPWYGFHRFKQGYGGELVEFIGSYDLVINPFLYQIYKILDKIRWLLLRLKSI